MISENISQNLSKELSDDNISFFIEEMLGDSHVSFEYILFLTIIYSIFLIVGVLGNLSTCMVIISNEYMRTPTNIYLLNLAIADLATLVISKKCTLLNCEGGVAFQTWSVLTLCDVVAANSSN